MLLCCRSSTPWIGVAKSVMPPLEKSPVFKFFCRNCKLIFTGCDNPSNTKTVSTMHSFNRKWQKKQSAVVKLMVNGLRQRLNGLSLTILVIVYLVMKQYPKSD